MTGFTSQNGVLHCDGASLEELAARFGTPLYVYSRSTLLDAYDAYDRAFSSVPHRICYAMKANGSTAILKLLAERGAGVEVFSGFELQFALRAGFAADHVVFSGVGKTEVELRQGLEVGIGEFNAESEEEIERISSIASEMKRTARVALRINPDINPGTHPYISTGLRDNKFGVGIAGAREVLARARKLKGIEIVGLQSHIGSQILDLAPVGEAARALAGLARDLLAEGYPLKTFDIGGGLGIDYETGVVPDITSFAENVLPHVRDLPLMLIVEPGRSLVARAGCLITRVLYLKENHGKGFVIVDAGMNDLLRPSLYEAYHRIEPVRARGRTSRCVDVVGPICESGDFLARKREMETVKPGELLAVRDAGAYGFVMSSNYNLRPRGAEVLVEDGVPRLVRRRETIDDLIRTEI